MNNFWIKNVLVPLFLIMPILLFAIPCIPPGTNNLRMIYHFDQDEGSLVEFAGKTYSKGVVPLEYNVTYPQLYYYLAGIFLFPYTLLKGINYQVIIITLRSFNVLIEILTIVFLYFFCLKFFKSIWVGILSCLLLATSPEYLSWLINSRPQLLEILFILVAFYFYFKLVEKYNRGVLLAMIVFTGLATATKFGGIFLLPIAFLTYLYSILKVPILDSIEYLKDRSKIIYTLSALLMVISLSTSIISVLVYLKIPEKFHILGIWSLKEFLHFRNFRILLLVSVILFLFSLLWFVLNLFTDRCFKSKQLADKYFFLLLFNSAL